MIGAASSILWPAIYKNRASGGGGYAQKWVRLNGISYLLANAVVATDGPYMAFSLWFEQDAGTENIDDQELINVTDSDPGFGNEYISLHLRAANSGDPLFVFFLWSGDFNSFLSIQSTVTTIMPGRHQICGSAQTNLPPGSKIINLFLDNVDIGGVISDSDPSFLVPINGKALAVPTVIDTEGNSIVGNVADYQLWFGNTSINMAIAATRQEFITVGLQPVDPAEAALAFGAQTKLLTGDASTFGDGFVLLAPPKTGVGSNGPGSCPLNGIVPIGTVVTLVHDNTTDTNVSDDFENVITIANQIQQTGAQDYSGDSLTFTFVPTLTDAP